MSDTTPPGEDRHQQRSDAIQQAVAAIELAGKAANAYKRDDLRDRLAQTRQRLLDPAFYVLVVGEFKQGKSTLINSLLNAPICPVDDDIATAKPTIVRYSEQPTAAVLFEDPDAGDERRPPIREEIPIDQVREYVTEQQLQRDRVVQAVEVGVPRKLLASGLVLVDTPGVGGLGSTHSTATIGALPMADAVIFASDASQEFSGPEIEFMRTALSMCPNLQCVLTKTDFYPAWRKILELDIGHLRSEGIDVPIQPMSSILRQHAINTNDKELNEESGFPALVTYLQRDIIADAERLTVRSAASDVLAVSVQLQTQFQAERQVLADPESSQAAKTKLEQAKADAERLRGQLAKWQQTLGDGIQDLTADVDHDLRTRFRLITRQADESIDNTDPATTWTEFEPWIYRRTAEDVTNNYAFLQMRSTTLAELVAEHFNIERNEIALELPIDNPTDVIQSTAVEAQLDVKKMTLRQQGMTGLRGGYMGTLMFTMLGNLAGLALGPVAIVAGLLMGRKALRDEKERQLTMRRQQAKNAHRKYTDEVAFLVGKDSRDTLRMIQRALRDYYSARADELHKSTTESLQAVGQAAQADEQQRVTRLRDVEAELKRISSLRDRAFALAPELRQV
jgi:GTPase Era involved in 16S rRNA processing